MSRIFCKIAKMVKIRVHIATLLLAIYSIVFAHNVIPHHHHLDIVNNLVAMFDAHEANHHHHHYSDHSHTCDHHHEHSEKVNHQHDHDSHEACHFEVRPINSKTEHTHFVLVVINSVFDFHIDNDEELKHESDYTPPKLPEGYNLAVPLRAPPVFA
ncbi:hypothetical protein [Carboxylicivirga marina]|uniref:Uncharacterized protein n=1 Tax=Carboxylicivirga marina TaxID=2800988 RepID=A0ABS1HPY0_9BACT|nr:hypothetical protein [Carboxylicivirga marina]MBK3519706.1 hypothetical protein [Carboxylicivirga marina]